MQVTARHFESGDWVRIAIEEGRISGISGIDSPSNPSGEEDWVAPAFWDIQLNGRWGLSFSSAEMGVEQVAKVVLAQRPLGTARLCPTLITAPLEQMRHGVRTIAAACEQDAELRGMVLGIHLEGPFLSPREGYRGAHPAEAIRAPDWSLFQELQEESGGRIVLLTLAPETPGAMELIERATGAGVTVALGHTAADRATIRRALQAGASLSTHLGNGIAAELARHPNPIWTQAAEDRLMASLIADGHHLDLDTLRVLARAKGPGRLILVSDASPLAGLPEGVYGAWAVDPSGKVVVAGTPYLAGSNQPLETGIRNLRAATSWSLAETLAAVTRNPARLLRLPGPIIEVGAPANLVIFRNGPGGFELRKTCVHGTWHEPVAHDRPRGSPFQEGPPGTAGL
jgi:N-acetylglucosamine-6-phosphate deacetylase